jgi:hypothetical protein
MKREREELEKTLRQVILNTIDKKRKIKDELENKFKNLKMSAKAIGFYNLTIPFNTIAIAELYLFTKALYEITSDNHIKPEDWFNPEEEKSFSLFKPQIEYKNDIIILNNVDKTDDNKYFCTKATYQEMAKIFSQGLITYNIRTQRETTTIIFKGKAIEIPTLKQNPIRKMTDLMVDGKFFPNMITLNYRNTGNEYELEYDEKNRTLAISVDNVQGFLDIIDGMHRMSAAMRAVELKPDINMYTMINILHCTEEEAQEFIEQEANHTPMSITHREAFKNSDTAVIIAKAINSFGNRKSNEMFDKIAMDYNDLGINKKYVTVETLAKAINHNFKIETPADKIRIENYLKEFLNIIIVLLKEKGSIDFDNNIFIGFIVLAKELYGKSNWSTILDNIVKNNDFEAKTLTQHVNLYTEKITKPLMNNYYNYFSDMVKREELENV